MLGTMPLTSLPSRLAGFRRRRPDAARRSAARPSGAGMTPVARSVKRTSRGLALFAGLLPLDRGRLPLDVIAGATLAALAIPEVMGYAKIAGTPVVTGLYTLLL